MTEFLHNAWSGWTGYTGNGKLPALLLAVLLCLWFGRRRKEQRALLLYTSVAAVCCILPVSAAVLMMYQTKFYNYEWIWSLVPLTGVTAYGVTVFLEEYREHSAGDWRKVLPVVLLLLATALLCGSMGGWDRDARRTVRVRAYAVLDSLSDRFPGGDICLWGPAEIMEYARERDAGIRLPYGRNLWDAYLDAYAYDVYQEDVILLERWMENAGNAGEADLVPEMQEGTQAKNMVTLEACVRKALDRGVNCILLSGETTPEILERMTGVLGRQPEVLEGFYLFYTGEEEGYGRAD